MRGVRAPPRAPPLPLIVLAGVLPIVGLLTYGVVRWREDRVIGQVSLALGWGGLAAGLVAIVGCMGDSAMCPWIPGATLLGGIWLAFWLVVGLTVDFSLWSTQASSE